MAKGKSWNARVQARPGHDFQFVILISRCPLWLSLSLIAPPAAPVVAYQRHRHCHQHRHSFLLFSFGLDCLLIVDVALAADVADVAFVERLLCINFCHSDHPTNSSLYSPPASEQCNVNWQDCFHFYGVYAVKCDKSPGCEISSISWIHQKYFSFKWIQRQCTVY